MQRSKKIIVVCHCLLNANSKVEPYAHYPGINQEVMDRYLKEGYGIIQLPCPETTYFGLKRWGMTREQFNHPAYIRCCQELLQASLDQMEAAVDAGYRIEKIIGIKGSPNCGVFHSCSGYQGGEINLQNIESQLQKIELSEESGVFIDVLKQELSKRKLNIRFIEIAD